MSNVPNLHGRAGKPSRFAIRGTIWALSMAVALAVLGATRATYGQERRSSPVDKLGSYERAALDRALAMRGLELEMAPEGKILRRIQVVNLNVFGADTGMLAWLNLLHRTTRENVIEREVLLRPGQVWDPGVVADTQRRLRDPLFTSLAIVVPVKAPVSERATRVDLLVVTRDIWSLRINSNYEIQENRLIELLIAPSENNFLGWRKQVAFVFDMDQGAYGLGPLYVDKNIAGSRLQLVARGAVIFSRASDEFEGSNSRLQLSYPLWSLQREWAADLLVSHADEVERDFIGTALRPYDCYPLVDAGGYRCDEPGAMSPGQDPDGTVVTVPHVYRQRSSEVDASVTRAFGRQVKHHLTAGYALAIDRASVADFPHDEPVKRAFERDILPRSERSSALYAEYRLFTPTYVTYRNLDTFDLPEERNVGPDLRIGVAVARRFLGSESDFARLFGSVSWTLDLGGDSVAIVEVDGESRLQDGAIIDNRVTTTIAAASPILWGALRMVGRVNASAYFDDTQNRFFALGGTTGLRGYTIGAFRGTKRVRGNLEARSMPLRLGFLRVGALGFWDLGAAADEVRDLSIQHNLGLGARLLIPQLQPGVVRFDWALPLTGATAGLPGRFIIGFDQVF